MADNEMAMDTRVTPSFHSANVRALKGYDADTAPLFQQTEEAFDMAYRTVLSIHDAREKAENDPTLNESARLVMTADFADKVMEKATVAFDRAGASLRNNIAALEKSLAEPVQARAAHTISVEIRNYVRELKTAASAMDFVRRAIDAGDHDTVSAVLGAPAYLSGMTPEQQAVMLRMYHEKARPDVSKRLAALKAAQDHLDRNAPLIHGQIEKAIGGDWRKVQMLRKASNATKKAFGL